MSQEQTRSGLSFAPRRIENEVFLDTPTFPNAPMYLEYKKGPWDKKELAEKRAMICFSLACNLGDLFPEESSSSYARLPDNVLRDVKIETDRLVATKAKVSAMGVLSFLAGGAATGYMALTDAFASSAQMMLPLGVGTLVTAWAVTRFKAISGDISHIERDIRDHIKGTPKIITNYPDYNSARLPVNRNSHDIRALRA